MHLSMISPIPPTWGGVGDMWGLGHTICAPWWGKGQLTVWGSKFNFFNMCSTIHCKKNLPGVGVGEWWGNGGGKATAVMPHGGGGGGGGGKVTGQWTIPPPRPRWGGGGLSLIGALVMAKSNYYS